MSNHLYSQKHSPISNLYYSNNSSTSRSILDNDNTTSSYYYRDNHRDNSYSSSRYHPSSTSYSDYAPSSFDISSSFSKRPSQALYNYSPLGAHMLGQSEAWLTSDSLAKRPKLKSACLLPVYPQRPGEKDCAHYMLTRTCKFGEACRFDHPIWVPDGGIPDWKEIQLPPVAPEFHPQRPGEPDCPHFLKTQNCKFGLNCKFNHPLDKLGISAKIDTADLPERPSEPQCSFYVKTGKCKFGATCKFHHPKGIIPSDGQEATNKDQTKENGDPTNDRIEVKTFIPNATPSFNSKGLPKRLGEEDCPFYLKTGSCKYAANCRYNHPDRNAISPLATPIPNLTVGLVNPAASILQSFQPSLAQTAVGLGPIFYPQRPGQAECDFYMKNGVCKYGESCKFHHPIDRSAPKNVKFTLAGLPRREGVSDCAFYMKTGTCKYGATCKFDHPPPGEVKASASKENGTTVDEAEENVESTGQ